MPGFVKTPENEARWSAAKKAAGKTASKGSDSYWRLSNYIYHKMGKSAEDQKNAELAKQELFKSLKSLRTSIPSTSVPNPSKVGSTAVKMPKAKSMPDATDKPSLFFKNIDKSEAEEFDYVKHPTLCKLRDFMQKKCR